VLVLLVEVARAQEATAAVEATRVMMVLAIESSTQEAAMVWDSAALHVKDVEDQSTLAERETHERVLRVEAENIVALASTCEDAKGLVQKIAQLEGELAEERRAQEVAEENSHGLYDKVVNAERGWKVSERERWEQFEELTLLQAWGFELCHSIVGAPQVRNHLSEGM
jgi:hypothetical protein